MSWWKPKRSTPRDAATELGLEDRGVVAIYVVDGKEKYVGCVRCMNRARVGWDTAEQRPRLYCPICIVLIRDDDPPDELMWLRGQLWAAHERLTARDDARCGVTMEPQAKACPFCGCIALTVEGDSGSLKRVLCGRYDCEAEGPSKMLRDEAIAAWNAAKR